MIDRFVRMGLARATVSGDRCVCFRFIHFGYGENFPQELKGARNLLRRRIIGDADVELSPDEGSAADVFDIEFG